MKKMLALVLAVIIVMGMAVSAAANDLLSESVSSSLPALAKKYDNVRLHDGDKIQGLSEEDQKVMADAEEVLKDVDSKGLALRYFFYVEILSGENSISLEFEPILHNAMHVMQYIDGIWVQLEHTVADDGHITVIDIIDAPLAFFMDGMDSPGGLRVELLPILTDDSYLIVQIHNLEEIVNFSEEIQNRMAEAKDHLKDACPAGFAVKYFFEVEIIGTDTAVSVDFEPIDHSAIVFKQYTNGAWVKLEHSVDTNGIITVSGLVNGPVAIFTE